MKKLSYNLSMILLFAILLASCDLLGIGGDEDESENNKPKVIWIKEFSAAPGGNASPIIEKNNVYLLGFRLQKVALETGESIWESKLGGSFEPGLPAKAMLLAENAVIVNSGDKIFSFSKSNGAQLWKAETDFPTIQIDTLSIDVHNIAQTADRIFVSGGNKIVGLSKARGSIAWEVRLDTLAQEGKLQQISALQTSADNTPLLFVSAFYTTGSTFQLKGNLFAIDAQTGAIVWAAPINELLGIADEGIPAADIAVINNQLIVLTSNHVLALNPQSGVVNWQTPLGDEPFNFNSASGLLATNNAIFINMGGEVLRLNAGSGDIAWRAIFNTTAFVLSATPIVLENGRIYHSSFNITQGATIRVIDAGSGNIMHRILTSELIGSGFDLGFLGGFDVEGDYLVLERPLKIYGIKLE